MNTRHFLDLPDIGAGNLKNILANALKMKKDKFNPPQIFDGLSLAMVFDKKSTRTRISFEVAMKQLGGHTIVMNMKEIQLSGAENIEDTAEVLSRFVDGVMIRMSDHEVLSELAKHSRIPVINGLTDHSHPCQIMADLVTVEENIGPVGGKRVAWFGDYNNVAKTWAQAAKIFDFDLIAAVPGDLAMKTDHTKIEFTEDPSEAAQGADVIVTDTWVSMGEEGKDEDRFRPFQVTSDIMGKANKNAIFMHCMPIHRGHEVTDDVLKSKQCVIYDEAENRLHAQKAILAWCLEESGVTLQKSFEFK